MSDKPSLASASLFKKTIANTKTPSTISIAPVTKGEMRAAEGCIRAGLTKKRDEGRENESVNNKQPEISKIVGGKPK